MQISTASELARVLGAKRCGDGYTHKCPAHEDKHESFSFKDGDKQILVTCHKGSCSREDVIDQLLWTHGIELVSSQAKPASKQIVATYDYQDADGKLLYQKVRYEPKDFRNRQPDGKSGEWIWNLKGVKEVPFRLPRIKEAIEKGHAVWIVEGEKDVLSLEQLGMTATCNTHGASQDSAKPKWTLVHSQWLMGAKEVVIIPDNDDAGRAHAKAIADSLPQNFVKILSLPGLPDKGDVSDWLSRGGTKDQLIELAGNAKRYGDAVSEPSVTKLDFRPISHLMSQTFEPPRWAIEDLLPEGLTIVAGAPKSGKSWLALDIALAVSRGDKVMGEYQADKGEVGYLALEDNERRLQSRLRMIAEDDKTEQNGSLYYLTEIAGMIDGGMGLLDEWLEEHPKCRLLIIDTLARFMPAHERGSNAYQADYAIVSRLQKLALKHRIALVVIHHVRKEKSSNVFDDISGSNGITGPADAIWVLKRAPTETTGTLTVTGRDIEENAFVAEFNKDSCRWTLLGDARQASRIKTLVAIKAGIGEKPFTFESVRHYLGVALTRSKIVVNALLSEGYVTRLEEKLGKAYQFKLTDKMTERILGS